MKGLSTIVLQYEEPSRHWAGLTGGLSERLPNIHIGF